LGVFGILLDIEGTTTPIDFVFGTLFPYARKRIESFVKQHRDEPAIRDAIQMLKTECLSLVDPVAYALELMDQDRKSTGLKELQGRIWQEGYRNGELHGEVFPDVPRALETWHRKGLDIRIYSSGSILAQQLLFSTTREGDLTRFLKGHFDTTTGPKTERTSYVRIAESFGGKSPEAILFISDVVRELDPAREAGMQTMLCVRPGNPPQPENSHATISTFDEIGARELGTGRI
jgi:enolase-phosphatase E1